MDKKKYFAVSLGSGFLLLILMFIISGIVQVVLPYDLYSLAGMRSIDDPLLYLWFIYPFALTFIWLYVYEKVKKAIPKNDCSQFFKIIFLVQVVLNILILLTMEYPIGFYVEQIITGIAISILITFVGAKVLN
jgi:hypothetical protein